MAGGFPHRMRFKNFNARYRTLAPIRTLARSDELALQDCKTILTHLKASLDQVEPSSISTEWALGKKHIFLSEGARQHLEKLRTNHREQSAVRIQARWRGHHMRKKWPNLKTSLKAQNGGVRLVAGKASRPRPQPISGTPPPDALQNGLFLGKGRQGEEQGLGKGRQGEEQGMVKGRQGEEQGMVNNADRCDLKTIQKTCSLFGLDLVNILNLQLIN